MHTLDLVISNSNVEHEILNGISITNPVLSDHYAVCFNLSLTRPKFERRLIASRKIKSIDFDLFTKELQESSLLQNRPSDDLPDLVGLYNSVLRSLLDNHAPLKKRVTTMRPKAPWFTLAIADEKRKRRKLERTYRRTNLDSDKQLFINQTKRVHELIIASKNSYYTSSIEDAKSDQKALFRLVNKLLHTDRVDDLPSYTSALDLANKFATFFHEKVNKINSCLTSDCSAPFDPFKYDTVCHSQFNTFKPVTNRFLSEVIGRANIKSCDLDPIPACVLRKCMETLLPVLVNIVNLSLDNATMPVDLKTAMILPRLKKHGLDRDSLTSYRPISNLPFVSKIIEKCVAFQLNEHITINGLNEKFQSAYKKYHSTETAIVRVHNDILCALDKGKSVILLLLDLKAAFDTVNHSMLITRLAPRFGIGGKALAWFKSYLSSRSQFVRIDDSTSKSYDLLCGVPQGSILGPLLYSLYTAPLADIARRHNLDFHFYADDSQLYVVFDPSCAWDTETAKCKIEACVLEMYSWLLSNRLMLSKDKTKLAIISSRFRSRSAINSVFVSDELIHPSSHVSNLGVVFDEGFLFDKHISSTCKAAFYHLRNIAHIRRYLGDSCLKTVVHALVMSRLDYCNSVLYGLPSYQITRLQHVQNAAARLTMRIQKFDHITPILISLHWLPIEARISFKILLLTYKILNGLAPGYLSDLISAYKPSRALRSAHKNLLAVPRTKLKTFGDRCFSVASPILWNGLPSSIKLSPSVPVFKKRLKTHFFKKYFNI